MFCLKHVVRLGTALLHHLSRRMKSIKLDLSSKLREI